MDNLIGNREECEYMLASKKCGENDMICDGDCDKELSGKQKILPFANHCILLIYMDLLRIIFSLMWK